MKKVRLTGNRGRRYIALAAVVILLSSCFKEDTPVKLPPAGKSKVVQIALGSSYINQVYFQFSTEKTATSDFRKWDLAFESSTSGYHVWINGGNMAMAALAGTSVSFDDVKTVTGVVWKLDVPSWNPDSTAIGKWTVNTDTAHATCVYLIDRGSEFGADRYWKVQFRTVNDSSYTFRYARLNGSSNYTKTISKNSEHNYILFSFDDNGKVVNQEPEKPEWDVLFTRYRAIITTVPPGYPSPMPYPVEGVLLNPANTSAVRDSVKAYSEIDIDYVKTLKFETNRDVIGYTWKSINFTNPLADYTVKSYYSYILKDSRGVYWKFRFLDFYNAQGERGYPKFEYQRL